MCWLEASQHDAMLAATVTARPICRNPMPGPSFGITQGRRPCHALPALSSKLEVLQHAGPMGICTSNSSFWKVTLTRSCGLSMTTKPWQPHPLTVSNDVGRRELSIPQYLFSYGMQSLPHMVLLTGM